MTTEQIISSTPAPASTEPAIIANTAPVANQTTPSFDFNSFFPEDVRNDPDFEKYSKNFPKDLQGIAKDYYHKNKHFGKTRDVVKAELEAEFNKPVEYKPEDYNYQLPEGYEIENEILDVAKNKARELGIKPELAQKFMQEIFNADANLEKALGQKQYDQDKNAIEGLKKEWGYEFENKLKQANQTLARFTTPDEQNVLESLPKDSQIIIAKIMQTIGSRISEGPIGLTNQPIMSAQSKINSIMADPNHAYHKGDPKAVSEVMSLYTEIAREKIGG